MSSHVYFAVFHAETDGGYSVTFPDVPGAVSEGDSFADALQNAKDALESALDFLVSEGMPLPLAREPEAIVSEASGAPVAAVEAETEIKTVRVNVSFDERLLARIDRASEESGQTRSGFLARAARELISRSKSRNSLRLVEQHGERAETTPHTALQSNDAMSLVRGLRELSACLGSERLLTSSALTPVLHGFGEEVCGPFYTFRSVAESLVAFGPVGSNFSFTAHEAEEEEGEFRHS